MFVQDSSLDPGLGSLYRPKLELSPVEGPDRRPFLHNTKDKFLNDTGCFASVS